MQRLPINLLEAGMIVGREVLNDKGIVLVSVGAELSDKLILRLENMHISKVFVKGCPVQLADYAPKSIKQKMTDLEIGFSRMGDDPLMAKFRVIVKAHMIKLHEEALRADGDLAARQQTPEEKEVKYEGEGDEEDIESTDSW